KDLLPRFPEVSGFEPSAAQALLAYDYPHNIRELEKILSLVTVLAEGSLVRASHLPAALRKAAKELESEGAIVEDSAVDDTLRSTLVASLEKHCGNVTEVARDMGKARQQVHRWMRRLRIDPKIYRS